MPDREKVIKGLECCSKLDDNCTDCPYDYAGDGGESICLRRQLMPDALALLKEQEPKPVIVTTNAYGTRFYHCPKCNRDLYVYPRQWYCSNCGQKVKWE